MKLTVVAAVSLMPNVEHARAHRESIAEMIGEGEDDDGGLAPDIEGRSLLFSLVLSVVIWSYPLLFGLIRCSFVIAPGNVARARLSLCRTPRPMSTKC